MSSRKCGCHHFNETEKVNCLKLAKQKQAAVNEAASPMREINEKLGYWYDKSLKAVTDEESAFAETEYDKLERQLITMERRRRQEMEAAWADFDEHYPHSGPVDGRDSILGTATGDP